MPAPSLLPPSIEALLSSPEGLELTRRHGRGRARDALRAAAERLRRGLVSSPDALLADAARALGAERIGPRPVVNATGVLLHTNLGRAPLAERARDAVLLASGYCDLEYDLEAGDRGRRGDRVARLLVEVFAPGEDGLSALAVNNNAAALLLALDTVANGRPVAVSRGELVAIGGDFRVPSILAKSGATLFEVGTTNKTSLADYEEALRAGAAAILKVHPSNYRIVGFTEEVGLDALGMLATAGGVPLVYDAGSGMPEREPALAAERTPREALAAGAHLVTFSGDKALGGPQAGILLGRTPLVSAAARNPLARALRPDKLALAALTATLELHRASAADEVPFVRMLRTSDAELSARAERLADAARRAGFEAEVTATRAVAGGGTGVDSTRSSFGVRLAGATRGADALAAALRARPLPIVARIEEGRLLLDVLTIDPGEDEAVAEAIASLATSPAP